MIKRVYLSKNKNKRDQKGRFGDFQQAVLVVVDVVVPYVLSPGKPNSNVTVLFAIGRHGGSTHSTLFGKVSILAILLVTMIHVQHPRRK